MMVDLSPRQKRILQAVVQSYIETAEPVASGHLAHRYGLDCSPATIRNEMAELEEFGLLQQPHTSAGRIPLDRAYRVYVNELMEPIQFLASDEARVRQKYASLPVDLEDILQQTAQVLAGSSRCTAVVSAQLGEARIRSIQLMPIDIQKALLVILTDNGVTTHHLLRLPGPLSGEDLHALNLHLKTHLRGATFRAGLPFPPDAPPHHLVILQQIADLLRHSADEEERIYINGLNNTLQQPEFADAERIRSFLSLLERTSLLASWLNQRLMDRIQISIGAENPYPEMAHCSLVSLVYRVGEQPAGTMALMGPTRMHYARAVAALEVVAKYLNATLSQFYD